MILGLKDQEVEQVLDYAFRLTDDLPVDVSKFEIDADRVRGFCDRWLDRQKARCVRLSDIRADPDTAERAIARVKHRRRRGAGGSRVVHLQAALGFPLVISWLFRPSRAAIVRCGDLAVAPPIRVCGAIPFSRCAVIARVGRGAQQSDAGDSI